MNHSTYQTAYNTLKQNAELLQNQVEIDIDALTDIVEQSIHAYKICQERIKAVENTLKHNFDALQEEI